MIEKSLDNIVIAILSGRDYRPYVLETINQRFLETVKSILVRVFKARKRNEDDDWWLVEGTAGYFDKYHRSKRLPGKSRLLSGISRYLCISATDSNSALQYYHNIFLAAHLSKNPNSPTVELLSRWANDEFDILYCDQLLLEVREKFVEKGITQELADEFIDDLRNMGTRVEITPDDIVHVIEIDPDYDIIIACAVTGGATHIITYDSDFEFLDGQYRGIKIMDGLHFLYEVRGNVK